MEMILFSTVESNESYNRRFNVTNHIHFDLFIFDFLIIHQFSYRMSSRLKKTADGPETRRARIELPNSGSKNAILAPSLYSKFEV